MKKLDCGAFIVALTEREADARRARQLFKPEWMKEAEYIPILRAIFDYMDEHKHVPSLPALHEYIEDKDEAAYAARYRDTLTRLEGPQYDKAKQQLAISKARDVAAVLDYEATLQSPRVQEMITEGQRDALMTVVSQWLARHNDTEQEALMDVRTAFDKLIEETPGQGKSSKVSTGISCIDHWTNGGLRPGQLGIVMAPTGNGKSAVLLNIAHHIALVEQRPVLFLSNELTWREQSERLLARMQAPDTGENGASVFHTLQEIQEDPSVAYRGLERRWAHGLDKRLFLQSVGLNATIAHIEEALQRIRLERGIEPVSVVVDFMERMKPIIQSPRDDPWKVLGDVAKELVSLAKKKEVHIWTAAQTNRSGLNKEVPLDMTHGQGSIQHFQEASVVIAVRKVQVAVGEGKVECLGFKELKQRHAAMEDREVYLRAFLDRMYITREEISPDQTLEESGDAQEPAKAYPHSPRIRTALGGRQKDSLPKARIAGKTPKRRAGKTSKGPSAKEA